MRNEDNHLLGFMDKSLISMGWSYFSIKLFDYYEGLQDTVEHNKKKYPNSDIFIVRINSKSCPIKVDYNERSPTRPRNHVFTEK